MAIEPRNPFETDDGPCRICGKAVDDCICPECPTCGGQGDPMCYREKGHPFRLSMPQVIAHQCRRVSSPSCATDVWHGNAPPFQTKAMIEGASER